MSVNNGAGGLLGLSTLFLALLPVLAGPAGIVARRGVPGSTLSDCWAVDFVVDGGLVREACERQENMSQSSLRQFQKESTPGSLTFLICLLPGSIVLIKARYSVGLPSDAPVVWGRLNDFRPLRQLCSSLGIHVSAEMQTAAECPGDIHPNTPRQEACSTIPSKSSKAANPGDLPLEL